VLSAEAQAACLAECGRIASRVEGVPLPTPRALPVCSDPDDQKFLELALACGAGLLVTKDRALLELARHKTRPVPFRIVEPAKLGIEIAAVA
jgi:predicted nucleic acid-binding protein